MVIRIMAATAGRRLRAWVLVQSSIEIPLFPLDALILPPLCPKGNKKLQNNNKNRAEDIDTVMYGIESAVRGSADQHRNDHGYQCKHHHSGQDDAQNSGKFLIHCGSLPC